MRQLRASMFLASAALVISALAAEAQVTVTVDKQIEAGSDQAAVFDFPGVGMLGNGQSANYMFGPGGTSLLFEQPPDNTWMAPTINCETSGQVTAMVTGPFEVTITDQSGGLSASTVQCLFVNRQAATAPATPAAWLALLAAALLGGALLAQRRLARD